MQIRTIGLAWRFRQSGDGRVKAHSGMPRAQIVHKVSRAPYPYLLLAAMLALAHYSSKRNVHLEGP